MYRRSGETDRIYSDAVTELPDQSSRRQGGPDGIRLVNIQMRLGGSRIPRYLGYPLVQVEPSRV